MDLIYALITKHFKLRTHTSRSLTLNTGASRALISLARWQHGTLAAAADMCTEWDICVADAPGSTAVTDLCVTLFHVCTRSRDTRAWKRDAIRLDILCHIFKCDSFRAETIQRLRWLTLNKSSSINSILMCLLKTAIMKKFRGGNHPFVMSEVGTKTSDRLV